jgi:hypothetical protein
MLSDEDISLAGPAGKPYRSSGWGVPEHWGVWSGDDRAVIGFSETLPKTTRREKRKPATRISSGAARPPTEGEAGSG